MAACESGNHPRLNNDLDCRLHVRRLLLVKFLLFDFCLPQSKTRQNQMSAAGSQKEHSDH